MLLILAGIYKIPQQNGFTVTSLVCCLAELTADTLVQDFLIQPMQIT